MDPTKLSGKVLTQKLSLFVRSGQAYLGNAQRKVLGLLSVNPKPVNAEQEAATRASFRVAHSIAKHGKPFIDGELIKDCIIAADEELSLSANTVARRADDIAEYILTQLSDKNQYLEWFSLALDESTDVSDTAQVLLFIRGIDKGFFIREYIRLENNLKEKFLWRFNCSSGGLLLYKMIQENKTPVCIESNYTREIVDSASR
ncbi:neuralized [Carabus blaptoides fortunei]